MTDRIPDGRASVEIQRGDKVAGKTGAAHPQGKRIQMIFVFMGDEQVLEVRGVEAVAQFFRIGVGTVVNTYAFVERIRGGHAEVFTFVLPGFPADFTITEPRGNSFRGGASQNGDGVHKNLQCSLLFD